MENCKKKDLKKKNLESDKGFKWLQKTNLEIS